MKLYEFNLDRPKYFQLENMVCVHGWRELAPFSYIKEKNLLSLAAYAKESPVDIDIIQKGDKICVSFTCFDTPTKKIYSSVESIVRRVLFYDRDISSLLVTSANIGKNYEDLVKKGWNRLLRSATLFEDFCKVLFTTNCSWALTKKICSAFCSKAFSKVTPRGNYPFPKADVIADFSKEELKTMAPVGYRNESLSLLADKFSKNGDSWIIEKDAAQTFEAVNKLKGFGHYASSHMLIILDFFTEIPTDSVVIKYLKDVHGVEKKDARFFMQDYYKHWKDDFWWGFKLESVLKFRS